MSNLVFYSVGSSQWTTPTGDNWPSYKRNDPSPGHHEPPGQASSGTYKRAPNGRNKNKTAWLLWAFGPHWELVRCNPGGATKCSLSCWTKIVNKLLTPSFKICPAKLYENEYGWMGGKAWIPEDRITVWHLMVRIYKFVRIYKIHHLNQCLPIILTLNPKQYLSAYGIRASRPSTNIVMHTASSLR